ncbi:MAG: hypothetical protein JXB29_11275 [Sedimentisphaerales bacterium]|nr:hypothetical protein [Sedimentisphaerales bacterium]
MTEYQTDNLDKLLEQNVELQLQDIDWSKFSTSISNRINQAQETMATKIRRIRILKTAAAVAAAILLVIILKVSYVSKEQSAITGRANVKLIQSSASAFIKIADKTAKSATFVDIAPSAKQLASCSIDIIESDSDFGENETGSAWIIITAPEPMYADNGSASKGLGDIIYLF